MPAAIHKVGLLAVVAVIMVGVAAFLSGFYWLPSVNEPGTLWQRMCRAAGLVRSDRDADGMPALPGYTTVVLPPAAMTTGTPGQIGHGATLALRCTGCHGARGLSGADAPNLAGQYPEVIYKELLDFKRGARIDAVMAAMAAPLSDQDMLDLAHYYAYLPGIEQEHPLADAPALVRVGDPLRGIAPCSSCHARKDGKVGAPDLDGEPGPYLAQQLAAFGSGSRRNDANAVMRGETKRMTGAEMVAVADHYAAH